jgi:alkyldihydroxyacetonephosphate synthase
MEHLFAGARLEAPADTVIVPFFPASAAGPDLGGLILGSEGRLGILTEVTVRIRPLQQREVFHVVFFPDFERGQDAVRQILQARLPLSLLRLSTDSETRTTLALAGHKRLMGALQRLLSVRGIKGEKCMLLAGFTGTNVSVRRSRREVFAISRRHKGVHIGHTFGREWNRQRFRTPYLRNTLWEMGYATDTLETAIAWSKVSKMVHAIESALVSNLADVGERVHAFTHLSHPYPHGSSIYTTYLFRVAPDPGETLRRWQVLKEAASRAIVALGGTISHQHGVGRDHMAYLSHEKGPLGIAAIGDLCNRFDPGGIMNPGKLVP